MQIQDVDYLEGFITKCAGYGITEKMLKEAGVLDTMARTIRALSPATSKTLMRISRFRNPAYVAKNVNRLSGLTNKLKIVKEDRNMLNLIRDGLRPTTARLRTTGTMMSIPGVPAGKRLSLQRASKILDMKDELNAAAASIRNQGTTLQTAQQAYSNPFSRFRQMLGAA